MAAKSQLASNALARLQNDVVPRDHTHIELIDVKCEPSGMIVTINFEQPFSGVIYSQGFFNDPKCR